MQNLKDIHRERIKLRRQINHQKKIVLDDYNQVAEKLDFIISIGNIVKRTVGGVAKFGNFASLALGLLSVFRK